MVPPDVTQLLLDSTSGDEEAVEALLPQVYGQLKVIARQRLARHGGREVLDTTGLVHESYLRLVDQSRVEPRDRAHFLALASRAMRFVLIDHARARTAAKRGGDRRPVPLSRVQIAVEGKALEIVALNDALDRLAERSPRLAELVDYRFFGGLTHAEIAEATGRSIATVKRDWKRARTWLHTDMTGGPNGG